jgi:L-amino acid N-acyltransferase YncA
MIVHARTPEQEEQLAVCIARAIGVEPKKLVGDMPYHALASVRADKLMGVVLFTSFREQSIEAHVCGKPGWVTRADLREMFAYPFGHLGVLRIWSVIARNNKPARRFIERLGFNVKCVLDDEFGEGKDGILYAIRRKECKWLR